MMDIDNITNITQDADLGRAVRIVWIDSGLHRDNGWAKNEEFLDDRVVTETCETVGLWMGENDTTVAIAQTRDQGNNNWMAAQIIWKPSIIKKEWL